MESNRKNTSLLYYSSPMFSYLRDFLNVSPDILLIVAPLVGSTVIGFLTRSATRSDWFLRLRKPSFYPPPITFPLVWTALYLMLGSASRLVFRATVVPSNIFSSLSSFVQFLLGPYGLFWAHLIFLNYPWSIVFFNWHKIYEAIYMCGAIALTGMGLGALFWRINPTAGYLLIPYMIWTSFATYLTYSIYSLNADPSPLNKE